MKKFVLFLPLILLADVNPFTAGLATSHPYGLTPDEKAILQNRKEIKNLQKEINSTITQRLTKIEMQMVNYNEQISALNEKVAAFNTLLDEVNGLQSSLAKLKKDENLTKTQIQNINAKIAGLENNVTKIQNEINNLKLAIKTITTVQNQNFMYLKKSIQDILKQLQNYSSTKTITPKEAFNLGKKYYFKKNYSKAKYYFQYALSKNYMPAVAAFYLGEIEYFTGNYKLALAYYKKSVQLYSKNASYTPTLLFHTAVSFGKLGNKKAEIMALEKIVKDFPRSYFAPIAKKMLEKLK